MNKLDCGHLPQHILAAFNNCGIDENDLDSAIEELTELGVNIIVRDKVNNDSFVLVPFGELHEDELDEDGEPVNDPITDLEG